MQSYLLEQIAMALVVRSAAVDLGDDVFSIPMFKDHREQCVPTWQSQEYVFTPSLRAASGLLSAVMGSAVILIIVTFCEISPWSAPLVMLCCCDLMSRQ